MDCVAAAVHLSQIQTSPLPGRLQQTQHKQHDAGEGGSELHPANNLRHVWTSMPSAARLPPPTLSAYVMIAGQHAHLFFSCSFCTQLLCACSLLLGSETCKLSVSSTLILFLFIRGSLHSHAPRLCPLLLLLPAAAVASLFSAGPTRGPLNFSNVWCLHMQFHALTSVQFALLFPTAAAAAAAAAATC
jgi:hypothetical protein